MRVLPSFFIHRPRFYLAPLSLSSLYQLVYLGLQFQQKNRQVTSLQPSNNQLHTHQLVSFSLPQRDKLIHNTLITNHIPVSFFSFFVPACLFTIQKKRQACTRQSLSIWACLSLFSANPFLTTSLRQLIVHKASSLPP